MAEPNELAHDVLVRVAEFVRKLPAEHLADLARGEAKLELVPKGGRRVTPTKAAPTLSRPAQDIAATMAEIGERAGARRYLEVDLKLTLPQLKQLASDLGITVTGVKAKVLDGLVEWAVGRRLDSQTITRAAGGDR